MREVARGQDFAGRDRFSCFPDQNTVHNHVGARRQVFRRELMFRGNVRCQRQRTIRERNLIALAKVAQGDQNIVPGIELQHGVLHDESFERWRCARNSCQRSPLQAYSKRLRKIQDNKSMGQILFYRGTEKSIL
jgi:hypothetical protein